MTRLREYEVQVPFEGVYIYKVVANSAADAIQSVAEGNKEVHDTVDQIAEPNVDMWEAKEIL